MGQLEPVDHIGPDDPATECPACILANEIFNEMSVTLEKASRRLAIDDVAFVLALIVESVVQAAPTKEAREFFLLSLMRHMDNLDETRVRHAAVMQRQPEAMQ